MSVVRSLFLLPLLCLVACSGNPVFTSDRSNSAPVLHGRVHGGQQPVTVSTIQLYAAGTTGDGSAAQPLLNPAPQTDASGSFNITGSYSCPSSNSLVYILASGGNPGLVAGTNNTAISLVATLGTCGSLGAATFIDIDEVTTVAAANALAPFATSPTTIGSSVSDTAALSAAFSEAAEFANTAAGTSPGAVPAGLTIPNVRIDTLADILASCVNSVGGISGDNSVCGSLFSLTTPTGTTTPTETFTSALHLAWAPSLNTLSLFDLLTPSAPFQPILTAAPTDFSILPTVISGLSPAVSSLSFVGTQLGSLAAVQSVLLTNNSGSSITLSNFQFAGLAGADFSQTNNCPSSLNAGGNCTVQVSFSPQATGTRVAELSITNNTSNSPLTIDVSGTGSPVISPSLTSASPSTLAIGSPATTVTLMGSGFSTSSQVYLYGAPQVTTYISPQSVSFQVLPYYLTYITTLGLSVSNGGYYSNTLTLSVVNATPTLTSISPATVLAGSPNFALTFTGTGIASGSTVLINGVSHSVTTFNTMSGTVYVAASEVASTGNLAVTIVNPAPGGGSSSALQLSVIATDNRVRTLGYGVSDLIQDPARMLLYASVGSYSTTSPNSLISINPVTGAVVTTQSLSGTPTRLAISSDGSYLYVSLGSSISRFILPGLTPDLSWTIAGGVEDLQVAPGLPHTLAVAYTPTGAQQGNVAIYDDGVARSHLAPGVYPTASLDTLAWGNDATQLYGTAALYSNGPEYVFSVTQSGVTLSKTNSAVFGNFVNRLSYNSTTGLLYDGYGNAVMPATGSSAGVFSVNNTLGYEQNPFTVDPSVGRAFYLNENVVGSSVDIQAFDASSYSFINSLTFSGLSGSRIVRWGASGLAVGGGSQIYLIDGPFVTPTGVGTPTGSGASVSATLTSVSPQNVPAGSAATSVTLTGAGFTAAVSVSWNGVTIPVTQQSATQIVATIPASLLTQTVSAPFYVNNGPGTENSNGVGFAVLPNASPNMQVAAIDLSGEDMVWDSTRNLLYVAVTNPSAPGGNSIAVVDPASTTIKNTVNVGNLPAVLAISGDNQYLYAGFQTLASVKRFALVDFSLNLTIPLNSGVQSQSFAGDIKVAPGLPHTIAVSMGSKNTEPHDAGGLAIFDDAIERPTTRPAVYPDTYKLTWGADSTMLYANTDPEFTPQSFSAFAVNNSGVGSRIANTTGIAGIGLRPHYDAGTNLIYADGGGIANAADGSANGFLEAGNVMVPDSQLNRAFIVAGNSSVGYQLDIYDLTRQTYLKTLPLPALLGYPTQLVRWGSQGLALLTDSVGTGQGMLYLLQGSDISGLSTPPAGSITLSPSSVIEGTATGATITVSGAGFTTASAVLVNGAARTTTFVSSTQLTFQLTAADQTFAHYLTIEVSGGGTASPATSLGVLNPLPIIASLNPATLLQDASNPVVTVNGSGFLPSTVVSLARSARTTTYVSPTQLIVALNGADISTAGTYAITATNAGPGGGTSLSATLASNNAAPILSSSDNVLLPVGSPAQTVSLFGSNFLSSTTVTVNGVARLVTYSGASQISIPLTAADLASAGMLSVLAANPAPGGGISNIATISVSSGFPGPLTFNPSSVVKAGTTPITITVNGSNFLPNAVVTVYGSARSTQYISSTQLTFVLTVGDQANQLTLVIAVVNPGSSGGSTTGSLPVTASAVTPVISSVSPTSFVSNSGASAVQVLGTGFNTASQVLWNGMPLAGNPYLSSTYLYVAIPANLLMTSGTATITVNNATAATPLSNAVQISIVNPPAPTLTSISPLFGPIHTAFTATLTGTNFTSNSTAMMNGAPVPTTFVSSTQLTAAVPASAVTPGNSSFVVITPAPGGGSSSSAVYTAFIPIANNSMIYNPTTQLFYLSVPSSAGAPYGNSIVPLDPLTGSLGTPIPVGSEPDLMAVSSDGTRIWVVLDGASAVRQVNLVSNTAGAPFSLPTSTSYQSALKATAIAAVPGQVNSVVVAAADTTIDSILGLYDNGLPRGSILTFLSGSFPSLQVNSTLGEIYAANSGGYSIYNFNSAGLTFKSRFTTASNLAPYSEDPIQLVNGRIYDDYSTVLNSETGAQLGVIGTTATNQSAPIAVDTTLGMAFQLNTPVQYSQVPTRIQSFDLTSFAAGPATIPVNVASNSYGPVAPPYRLTRWGSNGLAFRTNASVYALRSNVVKDLSATPADLGVTLSASGPSSTGSQTTYAASLSNAGPSTATEVTLTASIPSTGVLVSATSPSGLCTGATTVTCNLGSLPNGAQAVVTLVVNQVTSGTALATVQGSASQTDPNPVNNQASSTLSITGATYSVTPLLSAIAPSTVQAGSTDTVITLTGSGFGYGTTVLMDGAALPTTIVSASQATATVPAASLSALGWHAISVQNPVPGGGVSGIVPLSIFSIIKAGASHMVFEPFSRTLLATIGSAMPLGNSVEAITPATGVIGTPIPVGGEPTRMSLTDDGQILYVLDNGSSEVVRLNLATQQLEGSFVAGPTFAAPGIYFAVQPGSENTVAIPQTQQGMTIVDFDPVHHTATARASTAGSSLGGYVGFANPSTLVLSGTFAPQLGTYSVTSSGVASTASSSLETDGGPFRIVNGIAYTGNGGVADVADQPVHALGTFSIANPYYLPTEAAVAPDPALGRVFFLSSFDGTNYTDGTVSGLVAFNTLTYAADAFLPLNIAAIDGTPLYPTVAGQDVVRWGQDGIAALTNVGTIYLIRGPAIVPQLLQSNTPPVLTSSTAASHGSGNTALTVTGSNFLPGVAAMWNGSYRTTLLVDSNHITLDIPASDLISAGTASVTAANPGSATSGGISVTIN